MGLFRKGVVAIAFCRRMRALSSTYLIGVRGCPLRLKQGLRHVQGLLVWGVG